MIFHEDSKDEADHMTHRKATLEEWRALYEAACEFRKQACWNWMRDNQIFGIQNQKTGEIGYCTVMGHNDEHFALGVYKGAEGLSTLVEILEDPCFPQGIEGLHRQRCLMVSFENREFISEEDHHVIKKLGLWFKGDNAWPRFRDFTPGFHPWYLNADQCKFLTIVLYEAIDMAERVKDDAEMLYPEDEYLWLTRVAHIVEERLEWKDEWLEAQESPDTEIPEGTGVEVDENRLEKIAAKAGNHRGIWELGSFYAPQPIQEKDERPYYPRLIMYLDHDSGAVLSFTLSRLGRFEQDVLDSFLDMLEKADHFPAEIQASEISIIILLHSITEALGIKIEVFPELEGVEAVKESMYGYIGQF